MPGYASRLVKNEDRYPDPQYQHRLREFMQEVNPKPEHVLAAMQEIKVSKKRDMVVYATTDTGELVDQVTVWADSMVDALSLAGDKLSKDVPLHCNIAVCSVEAFERVKEQAAAWYRQTNWLPRSSV